jgi:hypothetical protein
VGGGSHSQKKTIIEKIESLMEYETAGDPMSGLKWTRKTTEKVSDELAKVNVFVSKTTVGKILKKLDYSLKTNSKRISNGGKLLSKLEQQIRDSQFKYISSMRRKFGSKKSPVQSVDTKKKELIGNFKNPGTRLKRLADLTNDHDFLNHALGKAALYGIYDTQKNTGFVAIGMFLKNGNKITSGDTPEFAVESIKKWWEKVGIICYPNTSQLLLLADAGGSNGYRNSMWKVQIQKILCDKCGLTVTVCHYPPGASKWNPIEHRLFSEISKNWGGTPLKDWETVCKYTRSTKTKTGLKVKALLVKKQYKKGIKATQNEKNTLNIKYHQINSTWNYTISPSD